MAVPSRARGAVLREPNRVSTPTRVKTRVTPRSRMATKSREGARRTRMRGSTGNIARWSSGISGMTSFFMAASSLRATAHARRRVVEVTRRFRATTGRCSRGRSDSYDSSAFSGSQTVRCFGKRCRTAVAQYRIRRTRRGKSARNERVVPKRRERLSKRSLPSPGDRGGFRGGFLGTPPVSVPAAALLHPRLVRRLHARPG